MAGATTAAIAGGLGLYQAISGNRRERRANQALSEYERQELNNAFEDMPISTDGIDYMRDENARASATLVDTLRGGDARTVVGGIPKVVAANNQLSGEAARYMDDMTNRRNYAIAGDNARIEGITENRDNQNINALSTQAQAGRQEFWDGLMGIGSAAAYASRGLTPSANPTVQSTNAQPLGAVPLSTISLNPNSISSPYSMPSAIPYTGEDIFGGAFDYGDMINKYPY